MRAARPGLLPALAAVVVLAAGCGSAAKSAPPTTSGSTTSARQASPTTSNWVVTQSGHQALGGWLDGVDCVTATSCVAVGNESSPAGPTTALVESLSHGSWSPVTAPGAQGSQGDYLFSVSCPVAGSCVAVGYFFSPTSKGGVGTMLVETLAKGKWSVTATPSPGSAVSDSFLYGVSCTSPTTCVAVGNTDAGDASTDLPLIVTLANGTWSVTSTPNLGSHGGLLAVSCTTVTTCTAVGYQATPASTKTLVESLGNGKWSVAPSPGSGRPEPAYGARGLNGLACVTAASCLAVGQLTGQGPVIDTMTNQQWSAASPANPGPSDGASGLYGVSCVSSTVCVAVGALAKSFSSNAPDGAFGLPLATLIESNSGGPWAVEASPSGLPADSGLHAVSCVGPVCVAVGQSGQFASAMSTTKTLIIQTR